MFDSISFQSISITVIINHTLISIGNLLSINYRVLLSTLLQYHKWRMMTKGKKPQA